MHILLNIAEEVVRQLEDCSADILVVDSSGEKTALKAINLLKERKKQDPSITLPEIFVIGTSGTGHTDLRTLLNSKTAPFATPIDVRHNLYLTTA